MTNLGLTFCFGCFFSFLDAFVEGAEGRENREEVAQCTTLETQLFMSAVRLASDKEAIEYSIHSCRLIGRAIYATYIPISDSLVSVNKSHAQPPHTPCKA